jgi:hypothetical protein
MMEGLCYRFVVLAVVIMKIIVFWAMMPRIHLEDRDSTFLQNISNQTSREIISSKKELVSVHDANIWRVRSALLTSIKIKNNITFTCLAFQPHHLISFENRCTQGPNTEVFLSHDKTGIKPISETSCS